MNDQIDIEKPPLNIPSVNFQAKSGAWLFLVFKSKILTHCCEHLSDDTPPLMRSQLISFNECRNRYVKSFAKSPTFWGLPTNVKGKFESDDHCHTIAYIHKNFDLLQDLETFAREPFAFLRVLS